MIPIDLRQAGNAARFGRKASSLARLASAGLPVPEGVVIPADAAEHDIHPLAEAIAQRYLGRRLAVRSSGVSEDLADASFAGQFETVLDVPAEAGPLAEAVSRVRASVYAPQLAAYVRDAEPAMAVLVMPMLAPDAAGIAFTRDPVSGSEVVVIEAVAGVADRLAAGEQDPERWEITGAETERITDLGVLFPAQARAVAALAVRVEGLLGEPQDVEWALVGDEVLLLQARPITALGPAPIPPDEERPSGPWTWDAARSQRPSTPLTASIMPRVFTEGSRRWVEEFGLPIDRLELRCIGGYVHFLVVPAMGRPGAPPPPPWLLRLLCRVAPPLRRRLRTARVALAEGRATAWHDRWYSEGRPRITAILERWHDLDLRRLDDTELVAHLTDALALHRETFHWTQISDFGYLLPLAELHRFLEDRLGLDFGDTLRLLAGRTPGPYLSSIHELARAFRDDPRAREALDGPAETLETSLEHLAPAVAERLRRHRAVLGARSLGFDLADPTLGEHPAVEVALLRTLVGAPVADDTPRTDEDPAAELRRRLSPADRRRFDDLLAEARRTYPIREDGEAVHAATFGRLRIVALEMGRRLVDRGSLGRPDDVLFLTVDELREAFEASRPVRDLVARRRGEHAWALAHPPTSDDAPPDPDPDAFPEPMAVFLRAVSLVTAHDARPVPVPDGADGVAASPGSWTGPVRIVRGPEEFHKVRDGDVLVAPITASPWEVLFPRIGALVTEGGGLLSHPAIVAREHRIPAVLGVASATRHFRDGDLVTVDGDRGTVTKSEVSEIA